jgi:hypothetical protein
MNPIEKAMAARSNQLKLVVAVVALELVLWITGSPNQTLWATPTLICLGWVVSQLVLWRWHRPKPGGWPSP